MNGWATSIDDGDGNTGGQILTFQVTNNTNPTLFSAGPAISPAGVLTYTPAADANGSATLKVAMNDSLSEFRLVGVATVGAGRPGGAGRRLVGPGPVAPRRVGA